MDWRGSSEEFIVGGDNTGKRYKARSDQGTIRGPSAKDPGYWSKVSRGKFGKKATCHPDRPHHAKGLCRQCYPKWRWENDPEYRERQLVLSRIREKRRKPRVQNVDDIKAKRDAKFYNLLPGERQRIWDFQQGLDPISGLPLVPRANMDHCHTTGLVRGLLNPITNRKLVDNIALLKATLAYLENPPAPQALEEKVYGLIGRAQNKKKMLYGPSKTPQPIQRAVKGK